MENNNKRKQRFLPDERISIRFAVKETDRHHLITIRNPLLTRIKLRTDDFSFAVQFGAAAARQIYEQVSERKAKPFPLTVTDAFEKGNRVENEFKAHFILEPKR